MNNRIIADYARILTPKLVDFELTTDLVFKNNGQSYGDAVPLTYDAATATWTANTQSTAAPFKVYEPSNTYFAAKGERGCCTLRDGRFVVVGIYSDVQWFPVKASTSNATVPGYSVVKVSAGTTVLSKPVLYVSQPDATFTPFYAMIGPQGISSPGLCGVATWRGPAYITASGATFGQGWGPQVNSWTPKRGSLGMWPLATVGTTALMLGNFPLTMAKGKTTAAINKGAGGSVEVWTGQSGVETASGMTISSAWNSYGNVGSAKWVTVAWQNDTWQLIAGEC